MKYIVVTGGVISGIGKGITISSIGRILISSGLTVTSIKVDPYLNIDAGTMSPFEHGETFVLDDGGETDLDLGNYERFLDITLSGKHNITTGKVYYEVIKRERRGDYLGKTVQIVPHVTDMVKSIITDVSQIPVDSSKKVADVCLIEVGGTVGDIESMVFLEALRQFQFDIGKENFVLIHVSLVPCLDVEQKTKPTQHSVKELRSLGLSPDIIICRSQQQLLESTIKKLSSFCQVPVTNVMSVYDVSNIYHVPLILVKQNIHNIIKKCFHLDAFMANEPNLESWSSMAKIVDDISLPTIQIAIVGKYTGSSDTYLSLIKSLIHTGIHLKVTVKIEWIDASDLEERTKADNIQSYNTAWALLWSCAGIIVPGGFGNRGVEGKILACKFARENKKPLLGICLGMQVMVIEYARSVLGYTDANSEEFASPTSFPAVIHMPEISQNILGGTMRLGSRETIVNNYLSMPGDASNDTTTLAAEVYGFKNSSESIGRIHERHRHRYEVNPDKITELKAAGLVFSGNDVTEKRMEIAELPKSSHPFYFGTQFHPEFKSRPSRPSPPFYALIATIMNKPEIGRAGIWRREHEEQLAQ